MMRGTFANVRIRNQLIPGIEGGFTKHLPSGETMSIYDAAMRYIEDGTPLCVLAGQEYGSGSSRDWAAKGPYLQGIKFVIAESYERIHRSNLIGMGILPLQFQQGDNADSLGLDGTETFAVVGLSERLKNRFHDSRTVTVRAQDQDGAVKEFDTLVRLDTPQEVLYYLHGGILHYVIRHLLSGEDQEELVPGELAPAPKASPDPRPRESGVDQDSKDSFPASDPPAH
jgi:aconitate hydratase